MTAHKRFTAWLAGPKSDFVLLLVALVLVNLAAARFFVRFDLTAQGSYSLSPASRELVASLEEPLSVRVYFTKDLPAPYNTVERYVRDLLTEYRGAGRRRFTFEFLDMEDPENRQQAQAYGLKNVQVQEVKDTEVGLKSAWMGLVLLYGDSVEVLDSLITTEGLEYRLTTTMGRMIAMNDILAGLDGSLELTLYASSALNRFNIAGYKDLRNAVSQAADKVNRKNRNRIHVTVLDPSSAEVEALATRYGLQKLNWNAGPDGTPAGAGVVGLTLSHGERFVQLPVEVTRGLFGGFSVAGLDTLEESISGSMKTLLEKTTEIAYLTGHGERSLDDGYTGSPNLRTLLADRYTLTPVEKAADIPPHISTVMINGPRERFTEAELYALDQFVLRGGRLVLFVDTIAENLPDQQMMMYGMQPTYEPVDTGLDTLFAAWGVSLPLGMVMDKQSFVARQQDTGSVPLYYVPQLDRDGLNYRHPVAKNLAYVLFLQSGEIEAAEERGDSLPRFTPLAWSSKESWRLEEVQSLSPYTLFPPEADQMKSRTLAALLEGTFTSAFAGAVKPDTEESAGVQSAGFETSRHLARSIQPGAVFLAAGSGITTPAVLDEKANQPVALLVRNAVDQVSGNAELVPMRTKGLMLNTLDKTSPVVRTAVRAVNLYGLPVFAALAGLVVWQLRSRKRKQIREQYAHIASSKEADK